MINHPATKAVVCMTTHNRVDCARISQEIIRLNYRQPLPIVHACSHPQYTAHLEQVLVTCPAEDLRKGALLLLKSSIQTALDRYNPDYLIHLEGDTWMMDESVLHKIIENMDTNPGLMLTTSAWDNDNLVRAKARRSGWILRAKKIFASLVRPMGWPVFISDRNNTLATQFFVMRNTPEMVQCIQKMEVDGDLNLEFTFHTIFMQHFGPENILRLRQREPIHPNNRYMATELSLFSQHWPERGSAYDTRPANHILYIPPQMDGKKETLQQFPHISKGEYLQKLLHADDLSYYNAGSSRI